ncbi:uncharacterized protein [Panulirus ornatus]|uniref:uncharacterized protein isoform X2 n=1 Tax=Panulirus ornatus TaxID=150431 RepID=UPI003A87530C
MQFIGVRMKVWMLVVESVLVALLWVACIALDIGCSVNIIFEHRRYIDGITLLVILTLIHIIINCWLVRIVARESLKLGILLFLILQIPLFLLFRGAWHGLRACCVQGERHKKRRALKAKFTVCCEVKNSSDKLPVEELEHREASCISSHNREVREYSPTAPLTGGGAPDIEGAAETPVKMTRTKFVKGTNKIQMTADEPVEIYAGEPSVYKYTIRCLQALFADKKRLSYHLVLDPTGTRILHASCIDKRIGSLPDRVVSENPRVICNDVHYILNLSRINGYEEYDVTRRSSDEVTTFVQRDLSKMIWLPIWPLAVAKIYHVSWTIFVAVPATTALVWCSLAVGLLTWLVTQRALYHSVTDRLLIAGHRLSFYVVRTIVLCSSGTLGSLLLIPIGYLSAKGAGALSFVVYIAFVKSRRNVELFGDAIDKYTFFAMYDFAVQVGESVVYCAWAISYYHISRHPNMLFVLVIAIIGQGIGLLWIWFARPRLRQPLLDPTRVLDMIKQMEIARQ